jgi:hypothetical protein
VELSINTPRVNTRDITSEAIGFRVREIEKAARIGNPMGGSLS